MIRLSPQAARACSRFLLVLGVATALATIFIFLSLVDRGPLWGPDSETAFLMQVIPWIGLGMAVLGLVWLVRIYRRDRNPEAGPSPWRFHEWD